MLDLMAGVQVSVVAVVLAAVASMGIGFLWYSGGLFGKTWMKLSGISEEKAAECKSKMGGTFALAFVTSLIMAFAAAVLESKIGIGTPKGALFLALVLWGGFVATVEFGKVLWDKKPLGLFIINAGHYLIAIVVMVQIIAFMQS
jgi:hypothetical protein